jgi:hypothetical protein
MKLAAAVIRFFKVGLGSSNGRVGMEAKPRAATS